jgi:ergothioneine biosynthesis protein EgtB
VQAQGIGAPLYWEREDGQWFEHTLHGRQPVVPEAPVCHVSYFEADAYARWSQARLPTELEWEIAAMTVPVAGHFSEDDVFHPRPSKRPSALSTKLEQMFGDVWEWTASPYVAYPGFRPWQGALGEYNGKFMCHQYVLRGGSCATPMSHIRPTYRNFFAPDTRWQFCGFRLAR